LKKHLLLAQLAMVQRLHAAVSDLGAG
jgi:hypothetical protein